MPKIIDPSVRSQIIKLYLEGKGRNEIAESAGVKEYASSGTVSAVIMQYKQQISSESVKELRADTTIAGLEESIENGVPGAEKEIQTPQTQPRSEQLSVEIEVRQKKEQTENDIVILDAELRYIEDRIDEGYRVIDTYKKRAADFSIVKKEMAEAGIQSPVFFSNHHYCLRVSSVYSRNIITARRRSCENSLNFPEWMNRRKRLLSSNRR